MRSGDGFGIGDVEEKESLGRHSVPTLWPSGRG